MARRTILGQRMSKIVDTSCGADLSKGQATPRMIVWLFLWLAATCFHTELTEACQPVASAGADEASEKSGVDLKKPRKWTDKTGNYSVVATFVSGTDRSVSLRREDGTTFVVPMERLSAADRAFALKALKQQAGSGPAIDDTLQIQTSLEFTNTPLKDMAHLLQERYRIPIVLDTRAMERLGLGPDVAVSIRGQNIPLHGGLSRALKPHGLTWTIGNETLTITSEAAAETRLVTWAYQVSKTVPLDGLIRDIRRGIAKESWSDVGGPAETMGLSSNILLVSQTPPNQLKILSTFKKQLKRIRVKSRKTIHPPGLALPAKALDSKTTIKFVRTPLKEIVSQLAQPHPLSIEIDAQSLGQIGLGTDTPVTIAVGGVSLRSALTLTLQDLGLTWQPAGKDKLVITSPNKAEKTLIAVSYPLPGKLQHDEVIEAMTRMEKPHMWQEVGGPGSAVASNQQIVVKQTIHVHYRIARLLKLMEGG